MVHRILLTGASGYIGGTILARLAEANLPPYESFFAHVRTPEQAEAVKKYGVKPLQFDSYDEEAVTEAIVTNKITIAFTLHASTRLGSQELFIRALAKVKEQTGEDVHFLHSTGAILFSTHAGLDRQILSDTDPTLYEIQKGQVARLPLAATGVLANDTVVELGEATGVKTYILAPCVVYGKGEGFGNKISQQIVWIVKAAKEVGKVYNLNTGNPVWPVCHIIDTATYYLDLLRAILKGSNPGFGRNGYYLASSGSVAWDEIYDAVAKSRVEQGVIQDASVERLPDDDNAALDGMAKALKVPKEYVSLMTGGNCGLIAEHYKEIGWKPKYTPHHIIESADDEIAFILENIPDDGPAKQAIAI